MRALSIVEQHRIVGGDFSFMSFIRGAACGAALGAGALAGPVGVIAGVTACTVFMADDAN